MSKQEPIDCKCVDLPLNKVMNRQRVGFIHGLDGKYTIMQYVGLKTSVQTWRVSHNEDTDTPISREYKFGGSVEYQCVHKSDVQNLIDRTDNGRPLFRIWKPTPTRGKKIVDAEVQGATEAVEINDEYTVDRAIEDLQEIQGVGHATAKKLVEAGYTIYGLSELDPTDDELMGAVADKAKVGRSIAILVVEGAAQWHAVVNKEVE